MFKFNKKAVFSAVAKFFKALKPNKKLFSKNFIFPVIAIIGIIVVGLIIIFSGQGMSVKSFFSIGNSSPQKIGEKVITYLNEKLLQGQSTATLVSVTEENGLIKLRIKLGSNELNSYATTDGKLFFPQAYNIDEKTTAGTTGGAAGSSGGQQQKSCEDIKKADKPLLEAFVVSKCPFGLQMQRILAEVVKNIPSLAKNIKVEYLGSVSDGKITSMHGDEEAQENLRQICIREEENGKYWDYISCHIQKGDIEGCLSSAGVNTNGLNACMADSSRGLKYSQVDFDLQKKYGAGGSPTMLLNGESGSEFWFGGRKAEAVKTLLCCGFKEKPSVCSQKLSEKDAAASFSEKYESSQTAPSGGSAGGGCQ